MLFGSYYDEGNFHNGNFIGFDRLPRFVVVCPLLSCLFCFRFEFGLRLNLIDVWMRVWRLSPSHPRTLFAIRYLRIDMFDGCISALMRLLLLVFGWGSGYTQYCICAAFWLNVRSVLISTQLRVVKLKFDSASQ